MESVEYAVAGNSAVTEKSCDFSVTPPTKKRTFGSNRDLMNLQSTLSPKYIGFANGSSPTTPASDTDDIIRTTRGRSQAMTPISNNGEDDENKTNTQIQMSSASYLSPIDKLLLKNGSKSPKTTGFESDAEAALRQLQKKHQHRNSTKSTHKMKYRKKVNTLVNQSMESESNKLVDDVANEVSEILTNSEVANKPQSDVVPYLSNTLEETSRITPSLTETEIEVATEPLDSKAAAQPTFRPSMDFNESIELKPLSLLESEQENHVLKSPSAVSIDSAKCSSIVTEQDWHTYQVGDIHWGKLFRFSYWPCMICPDPDGNIYSNLSQDKHNDKGIVHVRFFADNGRRNWIKQINLLPFAGLKAFEGLRDEVRIKYGSKSGKYRDMVPKSNKLILWHQAIKEATTVEQTPYPERLEKFNEIHKSTAEMYKRKRKRTNSLLQDTSDVGSSLYDSTDNLSAKPPEHAIKRERSETPISPEFSPIKTKSTATTAKENNAKRRKLSTSVAPDTNGPNLLNSPPQLSSHDNYEFGKLFDCLKEYVLVYNPDEKVEKCLMAIVQNLWSLRQLQLNKLQIEVGDQKTQALSNVGSVATKRLSSRLKSLYNRRSQTPATPTPVATPTPTPTLSDIAPSSEQVTKVRKVVNRPIDEVVNDILQLDRKYLFKGLNREPVCKYCHEPSSDLVRCSRNCNTWFHKACLSSNSHAGTTETNKKMLKALPPIAPPLADQSQPMVISEITEIPPTESVTQQGNVEIVCTECATNAPPKCCICHQEKNTTPLPIGSPMKGDDQPSTSAEAFADSHKLIHCSQPLCNNKFHAVCCKYWPQAKVANGAVRCPMHVCHTCVSDDPRGKFQQLGNSKLTKCVKCPATYHIDSCCIPAGSRILTMSHIICPRHTISKTDANVNVLWCYICVKGGELVCCETCPIAVHAHCRNIPIKANESYICEECESGRLPLYGEIVWAKFNNFRWWPALILPPSEIPSNILKKSHGPNEFVVRFFGTHDHGWISRRRVYLYIEGDAGETIRNKRQMSKHYAIGVEEASRFLGIIKEKRLEQTTSNKANHKMKPQPYVKIKTNKAVPPVRFTYNEEDITKCECKPEEEHPCGPYSGCLNRILFQECSPDVCAAGNRCENQAFQLRQSPQLDVVYMHERGFGLVCREPIAEGAFIVEYVGEVINHEEFTQRMAQKTRDRDENYYFLELEKGLVIDAGPKGNLARFMNHSCEPNCETQKWNINTIRRIGLFALRDIPANTELTFNYLWANVMNDGKKSCFCGAKRCSGQFGGKLKDEETKESTTAPKNQKAITKTKGQKRNKSTNPIRIQIGRPKKNTANTNKVKPKHISADDDLAEPGHDQ